MATNAFIEETHAFTAKNIFFFYTLTKDWRGAVIKKPEKFPVLYLCFFKLYCKVS